MIVRTVEPVHLRDLSTLMVSSQQRDFVRVSGKLSQQQAPPTEHMS